MSLEHPEEAGSAATVGEKPHADGQDYPRSQLRGEVLELDEGTNKRLLRKIDWRPMPVVSLCS